MNPDAPNVRVVTVDDHPAVLRKVEELLPSGFEVVGTLPDGEQLQTLVVEQQPDIVVLDITLPGVNGIELASRLTRWNSRTRIMFLSVHDDEDYAQAGFAAGALAYVTKNRMATDLAPALKTIMDGMKFISPGEASTRLQELNRENKDFAFTTVGDVTGKTK